MALLQKSLIPVAERDHFPFVPPDAKKNKQLRVTLFSIFCAGCTHDVRQIITSVCLYVGLVHSRVLKQWSPDLLWFL